MERLLIVKSLSQVREFESTDNGQKVKIKAIDLTLTDEINTFVASAYDKKAQQIIDNALPEGTLINADLSFTVRKVKTEKGIEFDQQQVRLNSYGVIVKP